MPTPLTVQVSTRVAVVVERVRGGNAIVPHRSGLAGLRAEALRVRERPFIEALEAGPQGVRLGLLDRHLRDADDLRTAAEIGRIAHRHRDGTEGPFVAADLYEPRQHEAAKQAAPCGGWHVTTSEKPSAARAAVPKGCVTVLTLGCLSCCS